MRASQINKISIAIEMQSDSAVQIDSQYTATVFEPNDANDPINIYNQESKIRENVISLETMDFVPVNDSFVRIEQEDLFAFLLSAIDSLPQIQRDVLMLHYVQNMNCAEIAITLGKSHSSTRQMLVRARKALRVMCRKVGVSLED